jgi:hypothetical protein
MGDINHINLILCVSWEDLVAYEPEYLSQCTRSFNQIADLPQSVMCSSLDRMKMEYPPHFMLVSLTHGYLSRIPGLRRDSWIQTPEHKMEIRSHAMCCTYNYNHVCILFSFHSWNISMISLYFFLQLPKKTSWHSTTHWRIPPNSFSTLYHLTLEIFPFCFISVRL